MLVFKVFKKDKKEDKITNLFKSKVLDYVKKTFESEKINIIDDSKSFELVSTDGIKHNKESLTIELTFKKTLTINNQDIDDKQNLDKLISEVKNFCDQAVKINNYVYLPLNMRERKNVTDRTSITGNRFER